MITMNPRDMVTTGPARQRRTGEHWRSAIRSAAHRPRLSHRLLFPVKQCSARTNASSDVVTTKPIRLDPLPGAIQGHARHSGIASRDAIVRASANQSERQDSARTTGFTGPHDDKGCSPLAKTRWLQPARMPAVQAPATGSPRLSQYGSFVLEQEHALADTFARWSSCWQAETACAGIIAGWSHQVRLAPPTRHATRQATC